MKNLFALLFGVAFLTIPGTALLSQEGEPAEESPWNLTGGLNAAVYSAYVWRGVELNPRGVFQPEVWLSCGGVGVSVWGNLDMTAVNDRRGDFNEFDYQGFYTYEYEDISATAKYIYYDYPLHDYQKTQEVGLELLYGKPLSVGLEAYYDFDSVKGTYLKPSVAYDFTADPFSLTPSVSLGWSSENMNESNFGVAKNCLADLEITVEAITDLGKGFNFSLLGAYYALMDRDLREAAGSSKDGFWGGGSLGFEF